MAQTPDAHRPAITSGGSSAWVEIDVRALRNNVEQLKRRASHAEVMAVVKADGYGHGALTTSRAALAGGATWLGVAQLDEALTLRAAGIDAPLLAWLYTPYADFEAAIRSHITLSVSSVQALERVSQAANRANRVARIHLKVDTGLARNGAYGRDWTDLVRAAARARAAGTIDTTGVWTHLVSAEQPGHPTIGIQKARFEDALGDLDREGFPQMVRHMANSAATLTDPSLHYDLVRTGLAMYGLSPAPNLASPSTYGLREVMRLLAVLAGLKKVPAGQGVSYGHEYTTRRATMLGLVPLGYGDGIPRSASNAAQVGMNGQRAVAVGAICMDQFVIDLGPRFEGAPGDTVVVFGREEDGDPTAQDWANAAGTINYEIVTRIGSRLPRVALGSQH